MLYLNFSNVEELVFFDVTVQRLLPIHMFSIFEQWRLAKRMSFLKDLGKQAILDFLNNLTDDDVFILEEYFGKKIFPCSKTFIMFVRGIFRKKNCCRKT